MSASVVLSSLSNGVFADIVHLALPPASPVSSGLLTRLSELGFLPGERVAILRRGPGGREPLAVQIGETLFALRQAEADCVLVEMVCKDAK
jgi:ferrous iron transport protein A